MIYNNNEKDIQEMVYTNYLLISNFQFDDKNMLKEIMNYLIKKSQDTQMKWKIKEIHLNFIQIFFFKNQFLLFDQFELDILNLISNYLVHLEIEIQELASDTLSGIFFSY
jgi:hypothetical protein